jgi:glycosyltransferase involved in cell wall biosynthesis
MRILYVAYPLLPVTDDSAGGAEQMLFLLEAEISRRGHQTTVAACDGSHVAGELLATGAASDGNDRLEQREAEHSAHIMQYLRRGNRFDLIHDKSHSFWRHAREVTIPVLATLHLPRSFYDPETFDHIPPNVYFNCVSRSQADTLSDLPRMVDVVENGIAVNRFPFTPGKQDFLLWLGRFCEEKGAHLAMEVAERTGLPLVLAGQVYPFSYHLDYFEREIRPHVGPRVQIRLSPSFDEKVRLLSNARAVLLTSLAAETSSLVAMEAMACGTPVIGFRRGAIPEVVADGETGFLVNTVDEMADAVALADGINPEACRTRVEQRYSASRMAGDYEGRYKLVVRQAAVRNIA